MVMATQKFPKHTFISFSGLPLKVLNVAPLDMHARTGINWNITSKYFVVVEDELPQVLAVP